MVCWFIVCDIFGRDLYSILFFKLSIECSVDSGVFLLELVNVWYICVIWYGVSENELSNIEGIGWILLWFMLSLFKVVEIWLILSFIFKVMVGILSDWVSVK